MTKQAGRLALATAAALTLAGCESARFGGAGPDVGARQTARAATPVLPPPVEAIPSGSVTSEPLAPIPGSGPVASIPDVPSTPPLSGGNPGPAPGPVVVANAAPSRSGAIGTYTARDATGANCRVTLSSAATLDLYRASASGCANKDLGRITAWDFRDGEVYLYQPGGSVAARLRSEGGSLNGVIAKSGAPLTLTR